MFESLKIYIFSLIFHAQEFVKAHQDNILELPEEFKQCKIKGQQTVVPPEVAPKEHPCSKCTVTIMLTNYSLKCHPSLPSM